MATVPTLSGIPPPSHSGRSRQKYGNNGNPASSSNGFHSSNGNGNAQDHNMMNGKASSSFSPMGKSALSNGSNGLTEAPSSASKLKELSSGAGGGSSPAVSYEMFAPRSIEQRSRLSQIQALTSGLTDTTISANANANTSNKSSFVQKEGNGTHNLSQNPMIPSSSSMNKNSQSYSQSESELESDSDAQTEKIIQSSLTNARQKSRQITSILTQSKNLTLTLNHTTNLITQLSQRHASLLHHSSELSLAAERLQTESDQLTQHAQEIGLPLKHYDAVDRLAVTVGVLFKNQTVVKGLARVKVDDTGEFLEVLDEIEGALIFFRERSEEFYSMRGAGGDGVEEAKMTARQRYESESTSGSVEYYKRSLVLQEAALDLLKEAIVNRIGQTTDQVVNALNLNKRGVVVKGDVLEASLIYTRFHGISKRSHVLLGILQTCMERKKERELKQKQQQQLDGTTMTAKTTAVQKKKDDPECPYKALWNLCRNTYTQSREALLRISVRTHLDFLREKHGLVGMTRLASLFLIRLCTVETALYLDFFGSPSSSSVEKDQIDDDANNDAQETSASNTNSQTKLAITQRKVSAAALASQIMAKDGTYYDTEFQSFLDTLCNNLHRTIRRGLVSVSDLDTLCQIVSVLREERNLANASPTTMAAARSLGKVIVDSQERLIFCANSMLSKSVLRFKATPEDLDYPDKLRRYQEQQEETDEGKSEGEKDEKQELLQQNALQTQMSVYESWFPPIQSVLKILSKIFRVVEPKVFEDIALTGVQACSRILKEGSAFVEQKSGVLHSDLFLVKHLLILREQLSPFDIELRSIERQLDFSDAGKAVSKFLANRNRRLFSMTTENALVTLLCEGLATSETSIDSKRDLEDALRSACNDFIEHTTVRLAGPVLTFVEQCKSSTVGDEIDLSTQSFMAADYVKAIASRAVDRLEPELGELTTQMNLYMDNPATVNILLRPVIRKIIRVLEEAKRFISESTVDKTEGGWNPEIKAEVFKLMDEIEVMVKASSPRT